MHDQFLLHRPVESDKKIFKLTELYSFEVVLGATKNAIRYLFSKESIFCISQLRLKESCTIQLISQLLSYARIYSFADVSMTSDCSDQLRSN